MQSHINPPFSLQRSKLEHNTWVVLDTNGFIMFQRKRTDEETNARSDDINARIDAQMNFIVNSMNAIAAKGMTL